MPRKSPYYIDLRDDEAAELQQRARKYTLPYFQHHGLRTRFLDITSNPMVALFHASEDKDANGPTDGRVHVFATPRSLVKPYSTLVSQETRGGYP